MGVLGEDPMSWQSIPPRLVRSLQRRPLLLAGAVAFHNRIRMLAAGRKRGELAALAAIAIVGALVLVFALQEPTLGRVVPWLLSHWALVVAVVFFYVGSLVARLRRDLEKAGRGSWLAATSRVQPERGKAIAERVLAALLWRFVVGAALASLLALHRSVAIVQASQLAGLIAAGALLGTAGGWWLSTRTQRAAAEGSRYVPRFGRVRKSHAPSAAALSRWPMAQAFAWSRPENTRFLLAAAILSVPGGTSAVGALSVLAMWLLLSYLVALLRALPLVARSASEWLRSTPIGFWAFAQSIAARALFHQCCGTLIATGVLLTLGTPLPAALYVAALWLAVVVLVTAVALADGYRGCSSPLKLALALAAALLAEERGQGWGISIALVIGAWHVRRGAAYERA